MTTLEENVQYALALAIANGIKYLIYSTFFLPDEVFKTFFIKIGMYAQLKSAFILQRYATIFISMYEN